MFCDNNTSDNISEHGQELIDLLRLSFIEFQLNEIREHGLGDSDTELMKFDLINEKNVILQKLNDD